MKYIGLEAANSNVKLVTLNNEDVYINSLKRVPMQLESLPGVDGKESKTFRLDGDSDAYVLRQADGDMSTSRDTDRYNSKFYKLQMLFAIANNVENGDEVVISTGLPSRHYKNKDAIQSIRSLIGTHKVFVSNVPKVFSINNVKIILQPIGTVLDRIFDKDGQYKDDNSASIQTSKILVVDIGWGTTDIAEIEDMKLTRHEGLNIAMMDMYTHVNSHFLSDNAILVDGQKSLIELDVSYRTNKTINIWGATYDLTKYFDDAINYLSQMLISKIKSSAFSFGEYDYVFFTGGGADVLWGKLEKGPNILKANDAQMANARGFYIASKFLGEKNEDR